MVLNKNGQHLIEYLIILAVVAVMVVVAMYLLRNQANFLFQQISSAGPGSVPAAR